MKSDYEEALETVHAEHSFRVKAADFHLVLERAIICEMYPLTHWFVTVGYRNFKPEV